MNKIHDSFHMLFLPALTASADHAQQGAGLHGGALGDADGGGGAVAGSHDLVLHLHGLQDEENVALLHGGAVLHIDGQNGAGPGGGDLLTAGGGGSGGSSRGRRRSSGGGRSGGRAVHDLQGDLIHGAVYVDLVLFHSNFPLLILKLLKFFHRQNADSGGIGAHVLRYGGGDGGNQRLAVGDHAGGRRGGNCGGRGGGSCRALLPQPGADSAHQGAEDDDADQAEEDGPNTHDNDKSVRHCGSFLLQKLIRGSGKAAAAACRRTSENVNMHRLRKDT